MMLLDSHAATRRKNRVLRWVYHGGAVSVCHDVIRGVRSPQLLETHPLIVSYAAIASAIIAVFGIDQVGQLVKDLKYLLYVEEEPEEKFSISEFDWDCFEVVTEKMWERIENETPFKYGEYVVTDSGFSFELVDESGMGSGIELYENVNMGIGLIYMLGSCEIK
jgi:hypothetical protein